MNVTPRAARKLLTLAIVAGSGAVVAGAGAIAGISAAEPVAADGTARDPAVVRTDGGLVRGTLVDDHRSFQGIPYAASPVGELRWRSPRPAAPWTGIREATEPGNRCAQLPGLPMDEPSEAEDCLYLNVTTPRATSREKLPVMVWIHGGHFTFGGGETYGGESLAAAGNVVVVSINYRLGPLGFLAHPALENAAGQHTSGNFGLEDQQAALRWVQRNAAAFGGDPGNVTLFGQSAGATSVCAHLAAPASAGLFHGAIMQSNSCTAPMQTRQAAEEQGTAFAAKLGCTDPDTVAACLREATPTELVTAAGYPGPDNNPGPVVGGPVLPVDPARALATGRFHRVPVMNGITHDEYRAQLWGMEKEGVNCPGGAPDPDPCPLTDTQYTEQLQAAFGDQAVTVQARYPRSDYGSASEALAAVMTDHEYARPALDADTLFARHVPTYAYEFADTQAPFFAGEPEPSFPTGAYHLAELPYLFAVGYVDPLDAGQRELSDQMIMYWARFAHTGNPNGPGAPDWPQFRASSQHVQSLDVGPGGIRWTDFARDHRYDFWRSLTG